MMGLDVQQTLKRVGVCDPLVVAGQELKAPASLAEVAQMFIKQINTAGEHKGDGEARNTRRIEMTLEMRKQRIVLAASDERPKGRFRKHLLAVTRDGAPVWRVPEVVLLLRNDPTDAAPRIGHVAGVPRDYMKMEMRDRLARGGPDIQPDIEAVRIMVLLDRSSSHLD
jgi:hypothetical protein